MEVIAAFAGEPVTILTALLVILLSVIANCLLQAYLRDRTRERAEPQGEPDPVDFQRPRPQIPEEVERDRVERELRANQEVPPPPPPWPPAPQVFAPLVPCLRERAFSARP